MYAPDVNSIGDGMYPSIDVTLFIPIVTQLAVSYLISHHGARINYLNVITSLLRTLRQNQMASITRNYCNSITHFMGC